MLTDGRTTDAGVTGILIAHLGAFGSGELKIDNYTVYRRLGNNLKYSYLTSKNSSFLIKTKVEIKFYLCQ